MTVYQPRTIDTSNVKTTVELNALVERLAENNHDHWAKARLAEGWQFGPTRNDVSKTHPDLIPYSDLPESEKDYDRRSCLETIKAIIALGYEIKPQS